MKKLACFNGISGSSLCSTVNILLLGFKLGMLGRFLFLTGLFWFAQLSCLGQQKDSSLTGRVSSKYLDKVSKNSDNLSGKIDGATLDVLKKFQRQEEKMRRKVYKKDSTVANRVFTDAEQRYKTLQENLNRPGLLKQYIPGLDTLKTSITFLTKHKEFLDKGDAMQSSINSAIKRADGLQDRLQQAEMVKQYLGDEQQLLAEQLGRFGFAKELQVLNKRAYYFRVQVNEYKDMIKNESQVERRAVDLLGRTKLFQDFMKKNSMLAGLFHLPSDNPDDPAYAQKIEGLQTKSEISDLIKNHTGAAGTSLTEQMQTNIEQAQSEMQELKSKIAQYNEGSNDQAIPSFRPSNLKTKSFLKRLEYGMNVQSQRSGSLLPATTTIDLSVGYKITDRSTVGISGGYRMGWGQDIKHIQISQQGVAIGSYAEVKLKQTWWLSAGYQMNYFSEFNSIEELKKNAWQKSGLIGLSKKIPVRTRFIKNTTISLLWDFLSYQQIPRAAPFVFKAGYSF